MSETAIATIVWSHPGKVPGNLREKPFSRRAAARLLREATEYLAAWGLPLDEYEGRVERFENDYTLTECIEVIWRHRGTGAEVVLTEIHATAAGRILQAGSQYGRLTL